MKIKYQKKLQKGDSIGLVSVSQSANLEKIDKAKYNLEKLGFKVVEARSIRNEEKHFIGADGKTRAEEFISLWKNNEIKHIISVRGGEFSIDMLPYLHEFRKDLKKSKNVKYVQGFSDTSLINFYITTNYNVPTLNCENVSDFWMKELQRPQTDVINIITGNYTNNEYVQNSFEYYQLTEFVEGNYEGYNLTEKVEYKLLGNNNESFKVEGRIIGGCIDVITQVLGTKFDNTKAFCKKFKEGMIWYIDNCELSFPELYRRLLQMKNAGWFDNINCLLIGRSFIKESVGEFSLEVALQKALSDLNIPIIYDVDIGHVPPQLVMINGSYGIFEYNKGSAKLTQRFK